MPQVHAKTTDGEVIASGSAADGTRIVATGTALVCTTPGLILGPFYPLQRAADAGARLWQGQQLPVDVPALQFQVRVVTRESLPVNAACVELWHADHAGRYPHPSSGESDAVLPGFTGYGVARTDADGRCEFETLLPGPYRSEGGLRARHLHLQISGRFDRLVTQVFLPDDALRHEDRFFCAAARPDLLLANILPGVYPALKLRWTAVLTRG